MPMGKLLISIVCKWIAGKRYRHANILTFIYLLKELSCNLMIAICIWRWLADCFFLALFFCGPSIMCCVLCCGSFPSIRSEWIGTHSIYFSIFNFFTLAFANYSVFLLKRSELCVCVCVLSSHKRWHLCRICFAQSTLLQLLCALTSASSFDLCLPMTWAKFNRMLSNHKENSIEMCWIVCVCVTWYIRVGFFEYRLRVGNSGSLFFLLSPFHSVVIVYSNQVNGIEISMALYKWMNVYLSWLQQPSVPIIICLCVHTVHNKCKYFTIIETFDYLHFYSSTLRYPIKASDNPSHSLYSSNRFWTDFHFICIEFSTIVIFA